MSEKNEKQDILNNEADINTENAKQPTDINLTDDKHPADKNYPVDELKKTGEYVIPEKDIPVIESARPAFVKSELLSEALSWAKTIVFAVAFALLINNFVIINTSVLSGSMENNIMTDDRLVAFRLSYLFSDPERFDIVVFRYPDDESQLYVKRVIGLPGETIEIRDGKVYIDGVDTPLRDDFIRDEPEGNFEAYKIPEGEYFMLGDNRTWSIDSRFWNNKTVAKEKILGKAIFKYWPGFKNLLGA